MRYNYELVLGERYGVDRNFKTRRTQYSEPLQSRNL